MRKNDIKLTVCIKKMQLTFMKLTVISLKILLPRIIFIGLGEVQCNFYEIVHFVSQVQMGNLSLFLHFYFTIFGSLITCFTTNALKFARHVQRAYFRTLSILRISYHLFENWYYSFCSSIKITYTNSLICEAVFTFEQSSSQDLEKFCFSYLEANIYEINYPLGNPCSHW